LRNLERVYLVEIDRRESIVTAAPSEEILRGGDRLVFAGETEAISDLLRINGIVSSINREKGPLAEDRAERRLVEVVVSQSCSSIGETVRGSRFHDRYGAIVLAVARNGERVAGNLGNIIIKPGDTLLLSGTMLTGRDAAHKRMTQMLEQGETLPVDLRGKFIYYVGPVDPVRDEAVGPAGPTTATRMDKFTDYILDQTGLAGMIGKAERGPVAVEAIKKHGAVYLMAVGGAAYLVSKAVTKAEVVAFEDLGMEAIYAFTVKDMPVSVAVDSQGESVHVTGPKLWKAQIEEQALELI